MIVSPVTPTLRTNVVTLPIESVCPMTQTPLPGPTTWSHGPLAGLAGGMSVAHLPSSVIPSFVIARLSWYVPGRIRIRV